MSIVSENVTDMVVLQKVLEVVSPGEVELRVGAVVSTVMDPKLPTEDVFPAWSVCLALTVPS